MSIEQNTSLLRFITAGSVDDGKSTLIGRLLYDSQALLSDQLAQLNNSKKSTRTAEGVIDFSQLTDGLHAEREQGITIDVAYRYFNTAQRKFIIADTPGHEQYTRNMVTAASTADAAIVLIDVSRLDFNQPIPELLAQTKRHSALLKLLGCKTIVVAVNKLDLFNYDQQKFKQVQAAYQLLAQKFQLPTVYYVPISALCGDNIVDKSEHTPWYQGDSLLTLLENLPNNDQDISLDKQAAHFPIQSVIRFDGAHADDFRGYQGRLEQGSLIIGQQIRLEPSARTSQIAAIYSAHGAVERASAGENLTITLADDVDISRGDVLVDIHYSVQSTKVLTAAVCWFDETPLNLTRKYLLKLATTSVPVKIKNIDDLWDVHSLSYSQNAENLKINDIGRVHIGLQRPILASTYQKNHATGAFILIDEVSNNTVAAGMVLEIDDAMDWSI